MNKNTSNDVETLIFGPYRLQPIQRRLWRGEDEIQVGGRAFDILVMLIEHAGKIVTQRELIERVWSGIFVEEATLRVHMAALRKALRDGENGTRYIATIPRRGYCFVGVLRREAGVPRATIQSASGAASSLRCNLPPALTRMVGREAVIIELVKLLRKRRFVSIVGAGGMGKTTVALAVTHVMMDEFDRAAAFVDLSAISSGELVDIAVATALGLTPHSENVLPELLAFLRSRRVLIVLDNCEHVVDSASALAERLFAEAPELFILATSREALRVEGESVYLLSALDCPPPNTPLTAEQALSWSAVQLFMERAAASGYREALLDGEAQIVASICSRLDGIALAIELAAGRVASHGIRGTAALLNHRFKLLWEGRRSAVPRHQTMNAMVDWSYNLLTERHRQVLARLSVFVGTFTLSAAQQIVADGKLSPVQVADALTSLADKSLIWTSGTHETASYRLLDMTRTYAAAKLEDSGEHPTVSHHHALYVSDCLAVRKTAGRASIDELEREADLVGNLRAALSWSFSDARRRAIAVELAARSVPLLLSLSLLKECGQWCERALSIIDDRHRNTAIELVLSEGLAISSMFTRGNRDEILSAIERGLVLAKELGGHEHEVRLLSGLHIFKARIGDVRGMMDAATRAAHLAAQQDRDDLLAMAEWMLGTAVHLAGDQISAQKHCEAALRLSAASGASHFNAFGYDHRVRGLIVLVRALWLRGFFDQAARIAQEVITEAEEKGQPVALCIALIYTTTAAIWSEDVETAERRIERLIACAASNSLEPYRAVGIAMRGEVAALRGDLAAGIADLRTAIAILESERHRVLSTSFLRALAEALAKNKQAAEASVVLDRAFAQAEKNGEGYLVPDLHRARGQIIAFGAAPDPATAERHFRLAIDAARGQLARGWELRAVSSLARLLLEQGRKREAISLLEGTIDEFEEGFDLPIMCSAFAMLGPE